MHAACQQGQDSIFKFLLDNNANINQKDIVNKMTPLHHAIHFKHVSACKLILEYDAVSTQSIESGITLMRAVNAHDIRALLEKALKGRRAVDLVCITHVLLTHFQSALDIERNLI